MGARVPAELGVPAELRVPGCASRALRFTLSVSHCPGVKNIIAEDLDRLTLNCTALLVPDVNRHKFILAWHYQKLLLFMERSADQR